MKERQKGAKKPSRPGRKISAPRGFWDHSEPKPAVISVRHSSSKLSLSLAFLRRLLGWERKKD